MSKVSKRLTDAIFTKEEANEYQKTRKIMSNRKDMNIQIKDIEHAMTLLRKERAKIIDDPSKTIELNNIKTKMAELNIQYRELNSLNGPGNSAYAIYDSGGGIKRKVVKRKVISIQSAKASRPVKPTTRKPIKPIKPTKRPVKPTKRPTKPTARKPTIVRRK